MTVCSSIDPARLLEEQLAQASPDLLRELQAAGDQVAEEGEPAYADLPGGDVQAEKCTFTTRPARGLSQATSSSHGHESATG